VQVEPALNPTNVLPHPINSVLQAGIGFGQYRNISTDGCHGDLKRRDPFLQLTDILSHRIDLRVDPAQIHENEIVGVVGHSPEYARPTVNDQPVDRAARSAYSPRAPIEQIQAWLTPSAKARISINTTSSLRTPA